MKHMWSDATKYPRNNKEKRRKERVGKDKPQKQSHVIKPNLTSFQRDIAAGILT